MIEIVGWEMDAEDYSGKEQKEVFYAVVNGKEKALSKADLMKQIKINLPNRGEPEEELPRPILDRIENGR